MRIDVLGGSYQHKYLDLNSQRAINWFPVLGAKQEKNLTPVSIFPTPGLLAYTANLGSMASDIYVTNDLTGIERCFAVIDETLYEIHVDGTTTNRGTLSGSSSSTSPAYMVGDSESHLAIFANGAGDVFNTSTNTLTQITDVDFPGLYTADFVDGYFVGTPIYDTVGRVRFSELNDPSNWVGDGVFTPTSRSDAVKRVIAWREELYIFGAITIEVYLNDGDTPWSRRRGTSQPYGLLSAHAADLTNFGIMFLGAAEKGLPSIYLYQSDYTIKPMSPPSINERLGEIPNLADCTSCVQYSKGGHVWWMLHVPGMATTFVYDFTTNEWHERQSTAPYPDSDGSPIIGMYRGKKCVSFHGMNLWIDRYSGKILKEDYDTHTEDGQIIYREITSPVFNKDDRFISVHNMEIIHNTGSGPGTIQIDYSRDGGHTFGTQRGITLPSTATYGRRSYLTKLGRSRRWVVRIKNSDAIDLMLMSVVVNGSLGER